MREIEFRGNKFLFYESNTLEILLKELFNDNYHIFDRNMEFAQGDIILDVGANEGIFSILMAKTFPQVRVISLEPVPRTFFQMVRNIGLNMLSNIEPHQFGVGAKSGTRIFNVDKTFSGGSSGVDTYARERHEQVKVEIKTLDEVFDICNIDRVKLLKIDIEGMEHEVLYSTSVLQKVDCLVGEFHINTRLASQGYDIEALAAYVSSKTKLMFFERCRMSE